MGIKERNGFGYAGFHPLDVAFSAIRTLLNVNPTKAIGAGGGKGSVILVDSNPSGVVASTELGVATLIDINPSKVIGAGGGKGISTLTNTNPSKAIGVGGGKGVVTLADANPSVVIT